jgi:hypothetical protein
MENFNCTEGAIACGKTLILCYVRYVSLSYDFPTKIFLKKCQQKVLEAKNELHSFSIFLLAGLC